VILSQKAKSAVYKGTWQRALSVKPEEIITFSLELNIAGITTPGEVIVKTDLPSGLYYKNNLLIDNTLSQESIVEGLKLKNLSIGKSKRITFDVAAGSPEEFKLGKNKLWVTTTVSYNGNTSSDVTEIEVVKSITELGKAGMVFFYFKDWRIWLGIFALLILLIIIRVIYLVLFREGLIVHRKKVYSKPASSL
jgi:hypothetical protein